MRTGQRRLIALLLLFQLSLAFGFRAYAAGGNGSGVQGGGDPALSGEWPQGLNSENLKKFVLFYVRNLKTRIGAIPPVLRQDGDAIARLKEMMKDGALMDDVRSSPYIPEPEGTVKSEAGYSVAAATLYGVRNAPVHYDRSVLSKRSSGRVVALLMHEHARHFSKVKKSASDDDQAILWFVERDIAFHFEHHQLGLPLIEMKIGLSSDPSHSICRVEMRSDSAVQVTSEHWVGKTKIETSNFVPISESPDPSGRLLIGLESLPIKTVNLPGPESPSLDANALAADPILAYSPPYFTIQTERGDISAHDAKVVMRAEIGGKGAPMPLLFENMGPRSMVVRDDPKAQRIVLWVQKLCGFQSTYHSDFDGPR